MMKKLGKPLQLCWIVFVATAISCNPTQSEKQAAIVSKADIEKGKTLAATYCQSCHLLPDPSQLDGATWLRGVLPNMGPRLGIFEFNNVSYPYKKFDLELKKDFYPSQPVLSNEQWQQIINYYTSLAPDTLSVKQDRKFPIQNDLHLFLPVEPEFKYHNPAVSFVQFDSANSESPIVIADASKKEIYRYGPQLKLYDSIHSRGPVVDLLMRKEKWLVCDIGILNPNNGRYGNVTSMKFRNNYPAKADTTILFSQLQRPVQVLPVDLNNDRREDYVVCEFGFLTGQLSWMENKGNGKLVPHVLRALPGAIKAYVDDYNKDGLKDLWVLFAQGEEGVFLYTNKGSGEFEEKEVLRFPSVYGSSYFEFADFNSDGFADILYTCGDNADYSTVLKPYHGLYIFLNDGKNNFRQQYFFPINGCYKAIARDFDNDGDLDIASISYFPDYERQPEEGFVYLENTGSLNFKPFSLPAAQNGRWLTMEAGDIDRDGKIDLLLGNFAVAPSFIKSKVNWKNSPPFLLLKNTGLKN